MPHVDEEHENERARAERVGVTAHELRGWKRGVPLAQLKVTDFGTQGERPWLPKADAGKLVILSRGFSSSLLS